MSILRSPVGIVLTFTAGGAITEGQPVKVNASGQAIASTGNTDDCVGIAQQTVSAAGDQVPVAVPGCICDAIAGGVLTAGTHARVMPGAAGLIAATTGNKACAIWLPNINQTSAVSGDSIRVAVTGPVELP